MKKLLIILLFTGILFALFNGLVINWKQNYKEKANYWREKWKQIGWLIRFCLPLIDYIQYGFNYIHLSILLFVLYPIYDVIIALTIGGKWYYQGTTSKINKLKSWLQYAIKIIILANMIYVLTSCATSRNLQKDNLPKKTYPVYKLQKHK